MPKTRVDNQLNISRPIVSARGQLEWRQRRNPIWCVMMLKHGPSAWIALPPASTRAARRKRQTLFGPWCARLGYTALLPTDHQYPPSCCCCCRCCRLQLRRLRRLLQRLLLPQLPYLLPLVGVVRTFPPPPLPPSSSSSTSSPKEHDRPGCCRCSCCCCCCCCRHRASRSCHRRPPADAVDSHPTPAFAINLLRTSTLRSALCHLLLLHVALASSDRNECAGHHYAGLPGPKSRSSSSTSSLSKGSRSAAQCPPAIGCSSRC